MGWVRSQMTSNSVSAAPRFPFSAIVGQNEMQHALLLAAVEPLIGGVLVVGDRGTGKSTAVRALAALLPQMDVVTGCPYNCDPEAPSPDCASCPAKQAPDGETTKASKARSAPASNAATQRRPVPVVDLPLGATEDRVVGALDLERALATGEKAFEPGLLARAHRGFLYVDEVNLLEDHLVDLLLDVAASGENVVEREGLSVRHPARFVLVGSGNPEEGDLRPQLLDRFGLSVDIRTPDDIPTRVEIVRRRDAFERDPVGFSETWARQDARIRKELVAARALLPDVAVSDDMLALAATLCQEVGTDGLRGELTLIRAARAAAALDGERAVTSQHVRTVAPSAMRHRLRRNPLDEAGADARVARAIDAVFARWDTEPASDGGA